MASSVARNVTDPLPRAARRDGLCGDCHGSGDIWVLDRHAGAIRIACDCGAEHVPDSGLHPLAMIACHGITAAVTILAVFLTL